MRFGVRRGAAARERIVQGAHAHLDGRVTARPAHRHLHSAEDAGDEQSAIFERGLDGVAPAARHEVGHRARRLHDAVAEVMLLVNTTSQGMGSNPALDLSLDQLPLQALVSDIVYIPQETPLLKDAKARGNPTAGGLGMLLHQARPAFNAWFGVMPEVTPALRQKVEATL